MKYGIERHPKFEDLKEKLGLPTYAVRGILDAMVAMTCELCPSGDIGKYDNKQIARYLGWDGDADQLVAALEDSKWLDPCKERRYLVHDWSDHMPEYLKKRAKRGTLFVFEPVKAENQRPVADNGVHRETTAASGGQRPPMADNVDPTQPNLTQSNPTQPNPISPQHAAANGAAAAGECVPKVFLPTHPAIAGRVREHATALWDAYPVAARTKKRSAERQLAEAVCEHLGDLSPPFEDMSAMIDELDSFCGMVVGKAREYAASDVVRQGEEKIPGPLSWLAERRWEDDPKAWQRRTGAKPQRDLTDCLKKPENAA